VKQLQGDCRMYKSELDDIHHENAYERELLLDSIRDNEKELEFLKQVTNIAFSDDELNKIRQKSKYDSINHYYKIPNFVIRNHKVVLPKLNNAQFNDYKESEVESRDIDFSVSGSFQDNGL